MKTQVTFTQEQINEIMEREYDCADYEIRQNAQAFQKSIDAIAERNRQREESLTKWKINE